MQRMLSSGRDYVVDYASIQAKIPKYRQNSFCVASKLHEGELEQYNAMNDLAVKLPIYLQDQKVPSKIVSRFMLCLRSFPDLMSLNEELLYQLTLALRGWHLAPGFGGAFITMGPLLIAHGLFIPKIPLVLDEIGTLFEKNSKLRSKVETFFLGKRPYNSISDILRIPSIRISRYPVYLQNYLRQLRMYDPDVKEIQMSLRTMQDVLNRLNRAVTKFTPNNHLVTAAVNPTATEDVIPPPLPVQFEGQLLCVTRTNNKHLVDVIMFNGTVLVSRGGILQKHFRVFLSSKQTSLVINESDDFNSELILVGVSTSILLKASNRDDRDSWVERFTNFAGITVGDSIPFRLGEKAPPYLPTSRFSACNTCNTAFTIRKQRCYCRACGKANCRRCIKFRMQLEYSGSKLLEVCLLCKEGLLWRYSVAPSRAPPGLAIPTVKVYRHTGFEIAGTLMVSSNDNKWWNKRWVMKKHNHVYIYIAAEDRKEERKIDLSIHRFAVHPEIKKAVDDPREIVFHFRGANGDYIGFKAAMKPDGKGDIGRTLKWVDAFEGRTGNSAS